MPAQNRGLTLRLLRCGRSVVSLNSATPRNRNAQPKGLRGRLFFTAMASAAESVRSARQLSARSCRLPAICWLSDIISPFISAGDPFDSSAIGLLRHEMIGH